MGGTKIMTDLVQDLKSKRQEMIGKEISISNEIRIMKFSLQNAVSDNSRNGIQRNLNMAIHSHFRVMKALSEINEQIRISNNRNELMKTKKYQRYQAKLVAGAING